MTKRGARPEIVRTRALLAKSRGRVDLFRPPARSVLRRVRPGSIVLMHENQPEDVKSLQRILPKLRVRGFRFLTVPELLALDPPTPKQVRRGPAGCKRRPG